MDLNKLKSIIKEEAAATKVADKFRDKVRAYKNLKLGIIEEREKKALPTAREQIDVKVNTKADGTTYAAADNITFASDAYSIIRELNVKYEGVQAIDTPNVNEIVAIRNKAEYSRAYLDVATSTLLYPDSGIGTASRTANTGFASNAALANAAAGVNLIVPLKGIVSLLRHKMWFVKLVKWS